MDRIAVGRPRETLKIVELPPKEKLNNFEIRIPVKTQTADHCTDQPTDVADEPTNATDKHGGLEVRTTRQTKRYASDSQEELDTRKLKRIRAFIARLTKVKKVSKMDALELGYATAILKDSDVEVNVPILSSYRSAVNDPIYRLRWRTAI